LLLNVLPHSIAERLKGRPEVAAENFTEVIADRYAQVTVLFADIVEFTKFAEGVSAEAVVEVLNDIFTRFDGIADKYGLEKIKTIGDAYMVAAGLPIPIQDHATRVAHMALDMLEAIDRFNEISGHKLKMRLGIDSGAAVAGVIGKRKFLYDVWGDVVNTASRMESHGVPGRIQVTDATRQCLKESFVLEERGAIEVKGKGEMRTWFLNSRSGATRSTPGFA
jgi:class 3 adenylate cyclase